MPEPSVEPPVDGLPTRVGAGRRASLVTIDQAISGVASLLLLIGAAHTLSPADFGRFTLVFFAWAFTQGAVVRSLVASTVVVHPEDAEQRPRAVLGATILLSLGSGLLCLVAGAVCWWVGSNLGPPLLFVGVLMPLLGVQDAGRYISVAEARPGRAIVLDAIWLGLMVSALAVIVTTHDVTLMLLVAAWAGAGALSGVWSLVQHGLPRARELSLDWLRLRWHFSWRSLVASSSSSAVALIGSSLLAIVSGPLAVAAVRVSLLLERPSTTVQTALATSAAVDIAREKPDNAGLMWHQRRVLLASIAVAAANFIVLLVVPNSVGELVLGNVWALVDPLRFVIGAHIATLAAQSGIRAALMGRHRINAVMWVDIVGTALAIIGLVIGAVIGDAEGAMWGAVVGQSITAVIWWGTLLRHLANHQANHGAGPEPSGEAGGDLGVEGVQG